MTTIATIVIPWEIPSQNQTERGRTCHVRARYTRRRRAAWKLACQSEMVRCGISRATGIRTLHITSYRVRRCSDIGNIIGGAKSCLDGLVDAGLLVDDADRKATITYAQNTAGHSPTGKPCTVIEVCEPDVQPNQPA